MSSWEHVLTEQNFTYVIYSLGYRSCIDHFFITRNIYDFMLESNDNDNDNEIDLFRHHNGNNTNIKVIFKQMTMLDKCNCI